MPIESMRALDELIAMGNDVLATSEPAHPAAIVRLVEDIPYHRWITRCSDYLLQTFGESSPTYRDFRRAAGRADRGNVERGLGVLAGAAMNFL